MFDSRAPSTGDIIQYIAMPDSMVKKMIDDAQKRAETIKKETLLEAKE